MSREDALSKHMHSVNETASTCQQYDSISLEHTNAHLFFPPHLLFCHCFVNVVLQIQTHGPTDFTTLDYGLHGEGTKQNKKTAYTIFEDLPLSPKALCPCDLTLELQQLIDKIDNNRL